MELLQQMVLGFTVLNFALFMGLGVYLFDHSAATASSKAFMVVFVAMFLGTTWMQWSFPCADVYRLGACVALLSVSALVCLLCANTILRRPFTAIFSEDRPKHFVSTGPYRYVRHPFYTSYLLTFFASALASSHGLPSACFVVAAGLYTYAAKMEENKFERSDFAAEYRELKKTTGMFLPRWAARRKRDVSL